MWFPAKYDTSGVDRSQFVLTRLSGGFAPIFYLSCEHVLFVYILKQRRKKIEDFYNLKNIYKNNKLLNTNCLNFDPS